MFGVEFYMYCGKLYNSHISLDRQFLVRIIRNKIVRNGKRVCTSSLNFSKKFRSLCKPYKTDWMC